MTGGVEARFKGVVGDFQLDAEFRLEPRGITALSGRSGAGKTTLLRCIAGLTRMEGRLVVDGEVWQDGRRFVAPHRRPIGVVFQEAALLRHLSVKGNLLYGARRSDGRRPSSLQAAPSWTGGAGGGQDFDEVVDLLSLGPLLGRGTETLSGGERQRVAMGRALLTRPRLLLLDEPLSSVDAQAKAEILPFLERLHRTLAIPTLYITHDASEIARLADHVLQMDAGRVASGKPPKRSAAGLDHLSPAERDGLALAALKAGLTPEMWPWTAPGQTSSRSSGRATRA